MNCYKNAPNNRSDYFYDAVRRLSPELETVVDRIKKDHRQVLNSKRRYSLITTFEDLVKVLIKRCYIDPSSDEAVCWLDRICQLHLHRSGLSLAQHPMIQSVPQHTFPQSSSRADDMGASPAHLNDTPSATAPLLSPSQGLMLPQLFPDVVERVARKLGWRSWWQLARELGVIEADIQQLELKYPNDYTARTREVLHLYVKEMVLPTPESIQARLEIALDRIKRPELRQEVQTIARHACFSQHNHNLR